MSAGFVAEPGLSYVEFESSVIGAEIRVGFGVEDDDVHHYQCGVFYAAVEIIEVWQGATEWAQHLTDSTVNVIQHEVYAELRRRASAAHQTRLDFYAPSAQFARISSGREFA